MELKRLASEQGDGSDVMQVYGSYGKVDARAFINEYEGKWERSPHAFDIPVLSENSGKSHGLFASMNALPELQLRVGALVIATAGIGDKSGPNGT